jgi:divalent metal cation (Fe/Co/Zn/Cd) transporter
MLSEGVHSVVDTGNQIVLLYGLRQSAKPPTPDHPFGFGLRLYFWAFVIAVLIFGLGQACRSSRASPRSAAHTRWRTPGLTRWC